MTAEVNYHTLAFQNGDLSGLFQQLEGLLQATMISSRQPDQTNEANLDLVAKMVAKCAMITVKMEDIISRLHPDDYK